MNKLGAISRVGLADDPGRAEVGARSRQRFDGSVPDVCLGGVSRK